LLQDAESADHRASYRKSPGEDDLPRGHSINLRVRYTVNREVAAVTAAMTAIMAATAR
jgi:hypothetical protein